MFLAATALLPGNIAFVFTRDQAPLFINELLYDNMGWIRTKPWRSD